MMVCVCVCVSEWNHLMMKCLLECLWADLPIGLFMRVHFQSLKHPQTKLEEICGCMIKL